MVVGFFFHLFNNLWIAFGEIQPRRNLVNVLSKRLVIS